MINHVRTLLLNDKACPGSANEEFVPPDFEPKQLSPALSKVRRFVFGLPTTRERTNLLLYQIMQTLHATELEEHVLARDPRVTYLPLIQPDVKGQDCGLPSICSVLQRVLTVVDEEEIFGEQPSGVYGLLYRMWKQDFVLPNKIGALMLAVAFRTEDGSDKKENSHQPGFS